jgi:hypothetical protein
LEEKKKGIQYQEMRRGIFYKGFSSWILEIGVKDRQDKYVDQLLSHLRNHGRIKKIKEIKWQA